MTRTTVVSPRASVRVSQVTTVNRNTEWLNQKAAWAFYCLLILAVWLVTASFTDPGMAWTYTHLVHGALSYYLLHWSKGSPIQDDQGIYDRCAPAAPRRRRRRCGWAAASVARRRPRAPTATPAPAALRAWLLPPLPLPGMRRGSG